MVDVGAQRTSYLLPENDDADDANFGALYSTPWHSPLFVRTLLLKSSDT